MATDLLLGHDLSTVLQCEKHGTAYYDFDNSNPMPPEQIVASHGANLVRLRLWVDPPEGYSDLPSVLQFAKRAKQANLKVLLCLHLSDYWADPGQQNTPARWKDQDFSTLCKSVHNYVSSVILSLKTQGTSPFIVAVGNEVSNGILWPTGTLSSTPQFTSLLKSGLSAVQEMGITSMVHINSGQDTGLVTWFMDLMSKNGVAFDYLGLSFYPGDGALHSSLASSLAAAATRYNKPILIAETAYQWTPAPHSPDAQASSLSELLKIVCAVPRGLGLGVCYWESGWLPRGEAYPGEGNHFYNRSLWDDQGKPLPALMAFAPYRKRSVEPLMQSRHHFWGRRHEEQ